MNDSIYNKLVKYKKVGRSETNALTSQIKILRDEIVEKFPVAVITKN